MRQYPFTALCIANYIAQHREWAFVKNKICLFRSENFTIWVAEEHREALAARVTEKARAVTESIDARCIVRKEVPISIEEAFELIIACMQS